MNYKRIYSEIIKNRLKNPIPVNEYGQRHHILPRSLFPEREKDKSNLIKLTYREHYICHWLLYRYYKSIGNIEAENKMWNAFYWMNNRGKGKYFNSHIFEYMRILAKEKMSHKGEDNGFYGKHHSEETKEKIRKKHIGCLPWNKGVSHTKETKMRISEIAKRNSTGRIWINDGKINKFVYPDDIPEGFIKGRIYKRSNFNINRL